MFGGRRRTGTSLGRSIMGKRHRFSVGGEITHLPEVCALLADVEAPAKRAPVRPKGSTSSSTSFNPSDFTPKKRVMSAGGKARIAAAQRARWAKRNATPAGKVAKRSSTSRKAPTGAVGKGSVASR